VKVEYAADLASTKYGSGFPTEADSGNSDEHFSYGTSLFNLKQHYEQPLFGSQHDCGKKRESQWYYSSLGIYGFSIF
jgi:hypothetical protein